MAYARVGILHETGYVPVGPSTEIGRQVHEIGESPTHECTVIEFDDAVSVPAGGAGEVSRWVIPVGVEPANFRELRRQAEQVAMPRLAEIIALSEPSAAQVVDAVKDLARYQRKIIRLVVGDASSVD